MLHVFNVNRGKMLTFEVNLAMERVLELKNAICETYGIAAEKQVMLISDGQALCDDGRVCTYAAGTETNPVYLFDKAWIEKETLQMESSYQEGIDFVESIRNARTLSPSYKTVDVRTKLAMRLHDATRQRVHLMKSLVHDEHLMFQGWQAAVANLFETVAGFRKRVNAMTDQCRGLFEQAKKNEHALEGMETILKSLEQIPILPGLLKSSMRSSLSGRAEKSPMTLLHWIRAQCRNVPVQAMYAECKHKQEYLSRERFSSLLEECKKIEEQAANTRMSEISGISERLAALDTLIVAAEQQVKEQTGIAQGFVRNRETARELQHNSSSIDALLTLCESHVTQLQIMSEYETMTRDAFHKCTHSKNELAMNLHTRLRWLYVVQRSILNADVKLSMFVQQLTLLQRQIEFLNQVKQTPALYLSAVVEVVRRKHFTNVYVQWANKAVAEARIERDKEIVKRKTFQSNIAGHFIQKLFRGLSDKPPSLSKKPLRTFDSNLPDITPEELETLSQLLPDYKSILEASSSDTSITSMTLTQSTSLVSPMTSVSIQSQRMDASVGSPPEGSKDRSPTASFAVVNPTTITQTQPGGFVVTSVENVKQANLAENSKDEEKITEKFHKKDQRTISQSEYSHDPKPLESPTDQAETDAVFTQIGDIISPDSPPDSEFFSIMPGSFGSARTLQDHRSMDAQLSTPGNSLTPNFSADFGHQNSKPASSRSPRKLSTVQVGSLESNSSTSYQKVDGISSDEEMFHSFTSDHQDAKSLRKKLHQLQSDYDILTEKSNLEKEELNILIRKFKNEVSSLEENQRTIEIDFEKRWGESKSELDNVIKQLENERLERKKAWTEGANLEKKLKTMEEEQHAYRVQMDGIQIELNVKKEAIHKLEDALGKLKSESDFALAEADRKLNELANVKENELLMAKNVSTRLEKELTLAQAELSTAEDRIQDLETMLSDHERKQEEDAVHFKELETEIHDLSRELSVVQESQQKSSDETNQARHKITEAEQKLIKANEQLSLLKNLLADYETKLDDEKHKDVILKNLRSSLHQLESEKLELSSDLESSRKEIENLRKGLIKAEDDIQSLKSTAMQDAKFHEDEHEKLKSTHFEELESSSKQHAEEVRILEENHERRIQGIVQENLSVLRKREEEWKAAEEELKATHRNALDELEADRLAYIATTQQSIEDLRERVRESNRMLDHEKREAMSTKDAMAENSRRMEEEYSRVLQENENLSILKSELEEKLIKTQEEIQNLQDMQKEDFAAATSNLFASTLTSSTDDEMESKRSKIDSGISDEMGESMLSSTTDSSGGNRMSMSIDEHKRTVAMMRKNFEDDKKTLTVHFKKKEEEAAKRRQMIFNSAIQRVTTSKDMEIDKLKQQLMAQSQMVAPTVSQSMMVPPPQSMTTSLSLPSPPSFSARPTSPEDSVSALSTDGARDKDRAAVTNFQNGDTVLVCYNELYQHFTLLTTSRTLHFVHHESLEKLGISTTNPESKKSMTFATLTNKEYCQARKAQNRFRVPINTKFYRVKVEPLSKRDSQA